MYRVILEVFFRENPDNPENGYVASPEDIAERAASTDQDVIAYRLEGRVVGTRIDALHVVTPDHFELALDWFNAKEPQARCPKCDSPADRLSREDHFFCTQGQCVWTSDDSPPRYASKA